jgi:probable HAF family extracellular repeat protein
MIDISDLGDGETPPWAVNNAGRVAGARMVAHYSHQAFIWENVTGMKDLRKMIGQRLAGAADINSKGTVVGMANSRAFVWDYSRELVDLGKLGGQKSAAVKINDSGQIVAISEIERSYREKYTDNTRRWTVRYMYFGDIPDEPNDMNFTGVSGSLLYVNAMNEAGQVVGMLDESHELRDDPLPQPSPDYPFIWDSTNGLRKLPMHPRNWGEANDINNAGQVVGNLNINRAFIWDSVNGMKNLGALGIMGRSFLGVNRANAINDAGQVVGTSGWGIYDVYARVRAFLWNKRYGMIDLNRYLPRNSHWKRLHAAVDINNRGQIIGEGETKDGQIHAFLMAPVKE